MTALAHRLASYADIEALPPHVTGQILDGELILSPRPTPAHSEAASMLGMYLMSAYHAGLTGPGGWRILDEVELHFGDVVLVPDIAGWRRDRWPDGPIGQGIEVAPDWICEVLSPTTERFDRTRKLLAYARFGVQFVWLVHPVNHTVEAYERHADSWLLRAAAGGNDALCAAPFDALTLPLRTLWLNPPPEDDTGDAPLGT